MKIKLVVVYLLGCQGSKFFRLLDCHLKLAENFQIRSASFRSLFFACRYSSTAAYFRETCFKRLHLFIGLRRQSQSSRKHPEHLPIKLAAIYVALESQSGSRPSCCPPVQQMVIGFCWGSPAHILARDSVCTILTKSRNDLAGAIHRTIIGIGDPDQVSTSLLLTADTSSVCNRRKCNQRQDGCN